MSNLSRNKEEFEKSNETWKVALEERRYKFFMKCDDEKILPKPKVILKL